MLDIIVTALDCILPPTLHEPMPRTRTNILGEE